jgi:hypothetical protein
VPLMTCEFFGYSSSRSLITGVGRSSGIEFQRREPQSYKGGWVRQGVCAEL